MLKKLLKYDLKWGYKSLIVFYILAIIFSLIVRVVGNLEQSLIVIMIGKICFVILIVMLINILINCFMRNWVRFVKNIYRDESYLTHTLPVSKNKIYLSKILTANITLLTSFIVIVICLAIALLNDNTWQILKESMEQSAIYFNSSIFSLVSVMIITIFFEFLFILMTGILGIIIGHKSNNFKIVKSIIIGFAIHMILSSISIAILYIAGLLNPNIMSIFENTEVSSNTLKSTMLVGIVIYAVYNLIIYFISNKLLNQGVDVD